MELIKISPDAIIAHGGRRQLDENRVGALMDSIQKIGLQTPVTIWFEDAASDTAYLVAGAHRVEACRRLDMDVDAYITNADTIDRDLWEIDENLCRSELTEAEEAQCLARRKELWEAREESGSSCATLPKTGRGNKQFATETSKVTGESKATINRKIARASKIDPGVLEDVKGTDLDKGVVLDEIAKTPKPEQRAKVAELALRRQEAERARKDVESTTKSEDRVIAISEAQQFADWLMARTDLSEMPTVIAWLEGTKSKDVIAAMRRLAA